MKKKYILLLLLIILPISVFAEEETEVVSLNATIDNNVINFSGTTQEDSLAVMCKLLDENNEEIDMLSVEVDDNDTFEGTFITNETGNFKVSCANYEGGTFVTKNVTITTLKMLTITFNTNGGTEIEPIEVQYNNTIEAPTNPTKTNYVFSGWYEDSTLTTRFEFTKHVTSNATLYARWIEVVVVNTIFNGTGGTYQVDFNAEGIEDQSAMAAPITASGIYKVPSGHEMTLTAEASEGYNFKGWYTTHEENTEWVQDEKISSNLIYTFTPTAAPYIMPVFEEITPTIFTVEFNTNGGTNIESVNITSGQKVDIPQNPTKADKIFVGWYEDETLTTEFDFNTPITNNITLYAKWIDPEQERETEQIQIWTTTGGKVAVNYTPSEPNTQNIQTKSGTNFVEQEEVQFYVNDEITAIAKASEGYKFIGWKHIDNEYQPNAITDEHPSPCQGEVFETSTTYTYKPTITTLEGEEEPLRYICAAFVEKKEEKKYAISDEKGNSISFMEENGHTFTLGIADLTNLTDEQLEAMDPPMTREDYEEIKSSVIELVKEQGTLLSFYEIEVLDENNNSIHEGPFEIKIKLTDDMKKYNKFKLIYIKDDFSLGNIVELKIEGDYLVGTIPHLSAYALVGNNSLSVTNAKTSDNIYIWFITLGLSMSILLISTFGILKMKKSR